MSLSLWKWNVQSYCKLIVHCLVLLTLSWSPHVLKYSDITNAKKCLSWICFSLFCLLTVKLQVGTELCFKYWCLERVLIVLLFPCMKCEWVFLVILYIWVGICICIIQIQRIQIQRRIQGKQYIFLLFNERSHLRAIYHVGEYKSGKTIANTQVHYP